MAQRLTELDKARSFAKLYVALVEALLAEGVVEDVARNEARIAAMATLAEADQHTAGDCPLCGK